tara:strand:+ start:368 stop:1228 length:861 start_codon:yes stop_codon:yes gene_type:complete
MNIVEIVNDQETFFNGVATSADVVWGKESQFAIQALSASEFATKTAISNPASVQNAIINIAACGISLNPVLKHAYLVPRKGVICLDISYQGLIHIATHHGSVEWVQSKLVYANDNYINNGVDRSPTHEQKTFGDKGAIVGAYCTAKTNTGAYLTEEMDIEALNKVKDSSTAGKGPWKTWPEEMMRKTVVKRASKYWPKCEQMSKAVETLNTIEGFEPEKEVSGSKVFEAINDTEINDLATAINNSGMSVENFCSHKSIKIQSLDEFPRQRLQGAINWLGSIVNDSH